MRVAYLGSRHPGSNYSGIECVLSAMLSRLAARGNEITVFSAPLPGKAALPAMWNGIEVVAVGALNGKHTETISRTALSLLPALRGRFDVVHFTHQGPGVFAPLTRLLGIPSVVSMAGLDWQRAKWGWGARLALRGAERLAIAHASEIITLSRGIQSYFEKSYGRQTVYIPNGLERREMPPDAALSGIGVGPDRYVLFAGRLVPEKGVHELIEAWNGVATDMKLVVAGGGRYDDGYVRSLHERANPERVIFTGHVEGETLAALFGHCFLFVLPSHVEGQSVALLEALGYGRATLVSSIPENTDVVGEHGFTFPVADVAALRARLQQLAAAPDAVRAVRERVRASDAWASWDDVARMHEEVYASVVRRRVRRHGPAGTHDVAATGAG